jgi:cysteine desulfurase
MENKKIIYLDYAASTPVAAEVFAVMEPYFMEKFGNPNSLHLMGQEARRAVDDAREEVKNFLGAKVLREIIFTGSATEANNLAIRGIVAGARKAANLKHAVHVAIDEEDFGRPTSEKLPHIITSAIEHKSVFATVKDLEKRGEITATYLKPDRDGIVHAEDVVAALRPETILVSIMYANNEIGTIQPLREIATAISEFRIKNYELRIAHSLIPFLHTDAVQAVGFLESDVKRLGVDMMTISGHKIYGPKGIGALYIREEVLPYVDPMITGGGQEYHLRSGTEAVPLIAGLGAAAKFVGEWKGNKSNIVKIIELRDWLIEQLREKFGAELNGASGDKRLPNNINIYLSGKDSQLLIIKLSEAGICVSAASACLARGQEPSHVLYAIGRNAKQSDSSIRITLGRDTTKGDLDAFLALL